MAKRFMFVCFGLLALVVAFLLGAQYGQAGYVDHSTTGIVAASDTEGRFVLLESGEIYSHHEVAGWGYEGMYDLPVPVSQVKFWLNRQFFVSTSNEVWHKGSFVEEWINYGSPPGVSSTQAATWSKIKAQFGE